MRRFKVTGNCIPDENYMVDIRTNVQYAKKAVRVTNKHPPPEAAGVYPYGYSISRKYTSLTQSSISCSWFE